MFHYHPIIQREPRRGIGYGCNSGHPPKLSLGWMPKQRRDELLVTLIALITSAESVKGRPHSCQIRWARNSLDTNRGHNNAAPNTCVANKLFEWCNWEYLRNILSRFDSFEADSRRTRHPQKVSHQLDGPSKKNQSFSNRTGWRWQRHAVVNDRFALFIALLADTFNCDSF